MMVGSEKSIVESCLRYTCVGRRDRVRETWFEKPFCYVFVIVQKF